MRRGHPLRRYRSHQAACSAAPPAWTRDEQGTPTHHHAPACTHTAAAAAQGQHQAYRRTSSRIIRRKACCQLRTTRGVQPATSTSTATPTNCQRHTQIHCCSGLHLSDTPLIPSHPPPPPAPTPTNTSLSTSRSRLLPPNLYHNMCHPPPPHTPARRGRVRAVLAQAVSS